MAFRRRVEQLRDETVGVHRVVVHQFGQRPETRLGRHVNLRKEENRIAEQQTYGFDNMASLFGSCGIT